MQSIGGKDGSTTAIWKKKTKEKKERKNKQTEEL